MADIITFSSLNLETHPTKAKLNSSGGYRAKKKDPMNYKFVMVKFENETIVTGVATQGYGDPDIKEWVTEYFVKLTRQKSGDDEVEDFIFGSDGRPKVIQFLSFLFCWFACFNLKEYLLQSRRVSAQKVTTFKIMTNSHPNPNWIAPPVSSSSPSPKGPTYE